MVLKTADIVNNDVSLLMHREISCSWFYRVQSLNSKDRFSVNFVASSTEEKKTEPRSPIQDPKFVSSKNITALLIEYFGDSLKFAHSNTHWVKVILKIVNRRRTTKKRGLYLTLVQSCLLVLKHLLVAIFGGIVVVRRKAEEKRCFLGVKIFNSTFSNQIITRKVYDLRNRQIK